MEMRPRLLKKAAVSLIFFPYYFGEISFVRKQDSTREYTQLSQEFLSKENQTRQNPNAGYMLHPKE